MKENVSGCFLLNTVYLAALYFLEMATCFSFSVFCC